MTPTCSHSTTTRDWTSTLFNGKTFRCEDMRAGCPGMVANDGYSYMSIDTSPDGVSEAGASLRR